MPSVKKNFTWSSILTLVGYIFPLITFPYISRVLGVEGVGIYQFAYSVVSYFSVFAMMGISVVGIREIAKLKDDKTEMSKAFSSLVVLNLSTTILAILFLFVFILVIPSFIAHAKMLYIGLAQILCGSLLIEWFYKGLEEFRYITIRSLLLRCFYVIAVFVFVRDADDYTIYFIISTITTAINAVINIFYSRKFVSFSLRGLIIRPYVKPFIIMGIYLILTAMYTSFNVMFLGAKCGDIEVGYYSTATKLYGIIMSFFTAFTGVMLPRMSSLLAEGRVDEFKGMTSKSVDFLLLFCLPVIIVFEVYAPTIIRIIAGLGYDGAILPMRIVMPLMLVIGYEQIIVMQMLMPLNKDNVILINSCLGATIGMLLNFTIVPLLASVGSALVWCGSEIAVLLGSQYIVTKHVGYKFPYAKVISSLIVSIPPILICIFLNAIVSNRLFSLIIGVVFVVVYCFLMELFVLKNELLRVNVLSIKQVCFKFIHKSMGSKYIKEKDKN